jgi:signal transduction histidine kinase
LASTPTREELGSELVRWVRLAAGEDLLEVRVVTPDRAGRLRTLVADGELWEGRRRSAKRREAVEAKRAVRLPLRRLPTHEVAIVPMVSRGSACGVIEVVAPTAILDETWILLEFVAGQGSIALRNLDERGSLRMQAEAFHHITGLSRNLVAATSPESAVRAAVRFCYEHLRLPVAGWLVEPGDHRGKLVTVAGLGAGKRRSLLRELWPIPDQGDLRTADLSRLERRFATATGARRVETVRAATAVLLVGGPVPDPREFLDALGPLLDEVLRHLHTVALAERRNQDLDLGIAWTAHELRTPLLALRGFLDLEMSRNAGDYGERAYRELEDLLQQIDGLLRWATGSASIQRRRTDLMKLIRDVASSYAMPEDGVGRLSIDGPQRAPVLAEPEAVRQAIYNVVRNALRYSPTESMVGIRVHQNGGSYVISVSDRGPGVTPAETEAIFDPFVRGKAGRTRRDGKGLGLFIARRVLEAHGGGITVEPGRRGATFRLRLPRERLGEMPSAS